MDPNTDGEKTAIRYYRDANGTLGQRAGSGDVELPEGAVELTAEEYDQAGKEWADQVEAHRAEVAKAAAIARKKAFQELKGLGLSPETAKLLLHMS